MAEEKYINKDLFGNTVFSDRPDSLMQPKYEPRDHPILPAILWLAVAVAAYTVYRGWVDNYSQYGLGVRLSA